MKARRVFLIVLDSLGVGELPDAAVFGDKGSNTLGTIRNSDKFHIPVMEDLGLFHIDSVEGADETIIPKGVYGRFAEASKGKDTTTGHWEMAGIISQKPLPVYPDGFSQEILKAFQKETGRGTLCNLPYSGTEVICDYGKEHMKTGKFIVYTSADSVFQIAAHEDIVPLEELYDACQKARKILTGKHGVGRVIARPFTGGYPEFARTKRRHDFSLAPPGETMLNVIRKAGLDTIGVGKIFDIFAGQGIKESYTIADNADGMVKTEKMLAKDFEGLCFVNLVDFDMIYGHRNDINGYAQAVSQFDVWLGGFLEKLKADDILMITSDHGCDPGTPSTDHSREYTFLLAYGGLLKENVSLGTRNTFADIGASILDIFGLPISIAGCSFWDMIRC